jgi:hypothetical protein
VDLIISNPTAADGAVTQAELLVNMSPSLKVKCLEPRVLRSWSLRFEHAIGYEAGGEGLCRAPLRQCGESNGIIDFECLDLDQIRGKWCGVRVPLKGSSVRVDMCGLTGEQDLYSDLGGDGPWHTGKIFDTMGKRKHVSCADDPGFFIFIERRKGGKVVANDLKEGGEMNQ